MMSFGLAATTYPYLWQCDLAEALSDLRSQGFQSTELMVSPPHISTSTSEPSPAALLQLLRTSGVRAHSLNIGGLDFNLASPWPDVRAGSVAEYLRVIDLAADIEAPFVVIIPGRRHPLVPSTLDQAIAWARQGVEILAERAHARDIHLAIENVPFGFLDTVGQVNAFVTGLDHPNVSTLYDAANAHMVEDEVQAARVAGAHALLVHLSDTTRECWAHDIPGSGTVAFRRVTETLRDIPFDGDAVLELTGPDPRTAFAASADALGRMGWARAA